MDEEENGEDPRSHCEEGITSTSTVFWALERGSESRECDSSNDLKEENETEAEYLAFDRITPPVHLVELALEFYDSDEQY